ncbi:MAG TPA: acyl-ACP--UDP-N-acetylglucosamine O-acyltransferase, partial [Firmicutes bacterium]|nr:acyl-ACP--UDP-N-acetylglucosamine O-acyltransferase [Bacillota bacterium]
IHPTAIINNAELGADCEVGPYVILGDNVKVGDRTRLVANVFVDGDTEVGSDCIFFPYSSIGTLPQDLKYTPCKSYVKIGNNNTFREFVTVNRATEPDTFTLIGHNNLFMAYSHVAHNCRVGDFNVFANVATLAGHVVIGNHVILGGLVGVHQFCHLGDFAIIGGATAVRKDVVPYGTVQGEPARVRGLNLVGLKRNNFSSDKIEELKEIYKVLFFSELNTQQSLDKLESDFQKTEELNMIIEFIKKSDRGIVK